MTSPLLRRATQGISEGILERPIQENHTHETYIMYSSSPLISDPDFAARFTEDTAPRVKSPLAETMATGDEELSYDLRYSETSDLFNNDFCSFFTPCTHNLYLSEDVPPRDSLLWR